MPTFVEYLLVRQDRPEVTRFVRATDGSWTEEALSDPSATLVLTSVGCELALAEVYEELSFRS